MAERILLAATRLFGRRGFANVSIREICQQAQASLPMVYYYFGSKEGLFEAVVDRQLSLQPFVRELESICLGSGAFLARLQGFIGAYLRRFPSEAVRVGWYQRGSAELDRHAVERFLHDEQRIHELAEALVREGVASGQFQVEEVGHAASCLLGMLNTYVMRRAHFREAFDAPLVGDFIYRFFLRAMGAQGWEGEEARLGSGLTEA